MPPSPETQLDTAIAQARALRLDDAVVRGRADEFARWARRPEPARWWVRWSPALIAAAAVLAVIVLRREPADPPADPIVQVGARVAIATAPGTRYAIVEATGGATEIEVLAGAVTARLYPGATPHRLRLTAGALEAVATGTIYTVVVPVTGAPYAEVHEGHVEVRDRSGAHTLSAGPRSTFDRAADELRRHPLAAEPAPDAAPPDAPPVIAMTPDAAPDIDAAPPTAPAPAAERWQRARQLRAQGKPRDALAVLDELIARADPTWSPLARVEAIRIHATVLADPRAVVRLAQRFLELYPRHALSGEVTEMLCRGHRDLGDRDLPSACVLK